MFLIKIRGSVFKLHQRNEKYPSIYYFDTYEAAQACIDYWDKFHCSYNHSLTYAYAKNAKGKDICNYVYTRLETTIEEIIL